LKFRPVVFMVWVVVLLMIPAFYMFSMKELAPTEDQGVVFGIIQAAPNATLDQTRRFAKAADDTYRNEPETHNTFQLITPGGGFGGAVMKPWSERKRTAQQILMTTSAKMRTIPGIRNITVVPPALRSGGSFPLAFVIESTAEPAELEAFANQLIQ